MEDYRLPIIRTWKTRIEGVDMLKKEIENYSINYDCVDNEEFFKIAYNYLISKIEYEGIDYRFLCWLNYKYGWEIPLVKPYLVEPFSVDLESFNTKYMFSEKRRELFEILKGFLICIKSIAIVDSLPIIIGGSFTDKSIVAPNDIDCVVLLDESYLSNFKLNEIFLRETEQIPKGIDIHFLPNNYTLKIFKAYSHIMYHGNKAKFKDGTLCTNNEFEKREILKIVL